MNEWQGEKWRELAIELRKELTEEQENTIRIFGYGFLAGMLAVGAIAWFLL